MNYNFNLFQPHYKLIALLGKGGYGEVYRAVLLDGRHVAIKFLNDLSPQGRKDFRSEVNLLESLIDVPYVVQIRGHNVSAPRPFFYMELCSLPISRWIGKLSKHQQIDLLWHLARAYGQLYARGIWHRDFNPNNILTRNVNGYYLPVFADFGIARSVNSSRPCHGTGTLVYTDPFVLAGGEFTAASDIYSLGITMYQIITGFAERPTITLNIPGNLNSLLTRMTDPEPAWRPSPSQIMREANEALALRSSPFKNAIATATGADVLLGAAAVGLLVALGSAD